MSFDIQPTIDHISLAKQKGVDHKTEIEPKLVTTLAQRVVGLMSAVTPLHQDIIERIEQLEEKYGKLDWRVALTISKEVAQEKFNNFETQEEAIQVATKLGFAYITVGVVSAPIEGLTQVQINQTKDNKPYLALHFAGPIRNAGGTAAAFSVVLADYLRIQLGLDTYDPTQQEIHRVKQEVEHYATQVNLQFKPTTQDLEQLLSKVPVQITGSPTSRKPFEVLPRVSSPYLRGGMCLVLTECLALKAKKLWKQIQKWDKEFQLEHWSFLDLISVKKQSEDQKEDTIAGRPTVSAPLPGGFRLRYGRTRMSGYSAQAIHPLTMFVLDNFLATGTQVRVGQPGKACVVTPCDDIEPPIVKLKSGEVVKLTEQRSDIKEILFLGDLLISYGDYLDRAHPISKVGYCAEWWALETDQLEPKNYQEASALARRTNTPIHPKYTYYWSALTTKQIMHLHQQYQEHKYLPKSVKSLLEAIGCPHKVVENQCVPEIPEMFKDIFSKPTIQAKPTLEYLNNISPYIIKDTLGTIIPARMGRPEKAKPRSGSAHGLIPDQPKGNYTLGEHTITSEQLSEWSTQGVKGTQIQAIEYPAKALARYRHQIHVNKDGTMRYDATEAPLTHFIPAEIGLTLNKCKELGYTHDMRGKKITNTKQIIPLKHQDIILPEGQSPNISATDFFISACKAIDDMLVQIYKTSPLHSVESKQDLIGQYIVGLAPHTSAGILGRIIGFSQTQTYLAHPFFHAAMRRDCDGDESGILLLSDALLNFSMEYLGKRRGATMDAPLVITTVLKPSEVDDMIFTIERVKQYPIQLYESAGKNPWEVQIDTVAQTINKNEQDQIYFTHQASMNAGPSCSRYKLLPTMQEKIDAQITLTQKIKHLPKREVMQSLVAGHFMRDIKGNLTTYAKQQFRTTKKVRRVLMQPGKARATVSPASVMKYVEVAKKIAEQFDIDPYIRQSIELLEYQAYSLFDKKKEKQETLTQQP